MSLEQGSSYSMALLVARDRSDYDNPPHCHREMVRDICILKKTEKDIEKDARDNWK